MSDLIERLRAKRMRVHDLSGVGWEDDPDCLAAADLLTSQSAAVEDYNNALAEIERLRSGLKVAHMAFMDIAQFTPSGPVDTLFEQIAKHARATTLEAIPPVRTALGETK